MGDETTEGAWWRRRAGRVSLTALVLVLVAGVALVLALGGRDAPQAEQPPSATDPAEGAAETAGPDGSGASPTDDAVVPVEPNEGDADGVDPDTQVVVPTDQLDPALPPVALDASAPFGDGVTASLVDVEAARLSADGPGEVSGPGLRLTVRVENGTDAPIEAGLAVVNLYAGAGLVPCTPMSDGARELSGDVPPGGSAEGVYVFAVPAELRDHVRVTVAYDPTVPMVVLEGPAPAA